MSESSDPSDTRAEPGPTAATADRHADDTPRESGSTAGTSGAASRRRGRYRPWLFALLLAALIGLLVMRPDVRGPAAVTARDALHTLAYDGLGLSPRQLFVWRLRVAGLYDSPLGRRWRAAADTAEPVAIGRQRVRTARFDNDTIAAHVYSASLDAGEQIAWRLSRTGADDDSRTRLYASLERRDGADDDWSTVTALAADGKADAVIVGRDGDYRIVLQPELFGEAAYRLAMATGGSLAMPVQGAAARDIGSGFGAPRDGGSRRHHGVDIFADRGTPVIAVRDGRVRTGNSGLGGKHIWLSGGVLGLTSARYYYAHLDAFDVESGDTVSKGDVIGRVGNTGNARTTPPHLHFGIYTAGGPVDPAPYLRPLPSLPGE
ncbi:M23 family metallopeptidase [Salinisphaera sp. T31B1]|uniref:M23 family metallopeptidase n=1 Tax=Salinisphaera sp. T31B1 TaxID=727963 RepID=UPI00334225C1